MRVADGGGIIQAALHIYCAERKITRRQQAAGSSRNDVIGPQNVLLDPLVLLFTWQPPRGSDVLSLSGDPIRKQRIVYLASCKQNMVFYVVNSFLLLLIGICIVGVFTITPQTEQRDFAGHHKQRDFG